MATDFSGVYRNKSDSELPRLSKEKNSLQPSARIAFDAEMRRRGLQEGDSHRLEIEATEEADRVEALSSAKKRSEANWLWSVLRCFAVFAPTAVIAVVVVEHIFKLSNEVVYLLTLMALKTSLGVAFLASLASRWLTFKRLLIAGVIFFIASFGCIVWLLRR